MHRQESKYIFLACLTATVVTIVIIATKLQYFNNDLTIKQINLNVKFATTSQERARGLCCRDSLPQNSGMLFVYDQPGNYRFWMKDTKIPLDMYWISSEKTIVHIEHMVLPSSFPASFGTDKKAQYILETNGGFAKAHTISVGDRVEF